MKKCVAAATCAAGIKQKFLEPVHSLFLALTSVLNDNVLNLLSDAFCGLTSEFFQRFVRSETGQSLEAHDLDHLQITMRDGKAPERLQ